MKDFLIWLFCGVIFTMMVGNANAADCNGFKPFHGGVAGQGAHTKASCSCDSCHSGGFNRGTAPATCVGCHMGQKSTAMQKPATHIQTAAIGCESCHSASLMSFAGANMNHTSVAGQDCTSCHGVNPASRGKPSDHIHTSLDCVTCHKTSSWDAHMNHTGITTGCAQCHKQSSGHVATQLECTVCHNTSNFSSWSCGQ